MDKVDQPPKKVEYLFYMLKIEIKHFLVIFVLNLVKMSKRRKWNKKMMKKSKRISE